MRVRIAIHIKINIRIQIRTILRIGYFTLILNNIH